MKTILVSGASGIVGYGTLKSLREAGESYHLIGTSIYNDSVAPAFCDVFEQAPLTTSGEYMDWLCGVIKKHKVDMIIPGINDDMLAWNEHRDTLAKTGVIALLNNPSLIDLCADKWEFYDSLQSNVQVSKYLIDSTLKGGFASLSNDLGLPFLLKPRRGFASKGIVIVDSEADFTPHQQDLGAVVMAQPIVGDKETEYTVSAFFDSNSTLLAHMGLRRKLSKEGFTEKAEVATPPQTVGAIRAMAAVLKPVGPTNFQFRVHNGQLKLLEINPRISSATSIRTAFGYNESAMAAKYFLEGIAPTQPEITQGYAVRYTEDKVFYDRPTV